MRLSLGEIALALGCGPAFLMWEDVQGRRCVASEGGSLCGFASLRELSRSRLEDDVQGVSPGAAWEQAPWAGVVPTGCRTDSRDVCPGNIFVCLKGERSDGHDFALEAVNAGASAIIAERDPFAAGWIGPWEHPALPPVFLVPDAVKALWRLAVCHRDTSLARVVGVTGTSGKTSVKEVLAQVLVERGLTERNPLNLNNQIGLPVSMLNASADASFWVMEAGISQPHDMDELGAILRPDLGLILNVGEGHLEGLGNKGVAHYKAKLLDYIMPGGSAVVSVDYPELAAEAKSRKAALAARGVDLRYFSATGEQADCRVDYLGPGVSSAGRFQVCVSGLEFVVEAPFFGLLGAENVAAIVAVAFRLGLTTPEIVAGFAKAKLPRQRFAYERHGAFTLVDDSYNANPLSAARVLESVRGIADRTAAPLILVMGEMGELGSGAQEAHVRLGNAMAAAKPQLVFWKGGQDGPVRRGLAQGGYAGPFYPVAGGQEFSVLLEEADLVEGIVLFKGSRMNKLERLVDIFRECVMEPGEADAV